MKLCLLQPCTESLFLALFHEFRVTLSPVLLEMIQSNHALVSPSDLNAILRKDAVYNAVGLAAFDLYDEVWPCFSVIIFKIILKPILNDKHFTSNTSYFILCCAGLHVSVFIDHHQACLWIMFYKCWLHIGIPPCLQLCQCVYLLYKYIKVGGRNSEWYRNYMWMLGMLLRMSDCTIHYSVPRL